MKVLVADKNAAAAERVAREIGGEALAFDISKYDQAKAALADCTVDVLVNNAGWGPLPGLRRHRPDGMGHADRHQPAKRGVAKRPQ